MKKTAKKRIRKYSAGAVIVLILSIFLATAALAASAVTGISVTTPPTKTAYIEGQVFNTTGMIVTETFSNGKTAAVKNYTYDKTPLTTSATAVTISFSVSSHKFTATTPVTVSAKEMTGISVTKKPTKTSYIEGQVFNPAGMVVTASYNNGTTAAVTGYTFDNAPLTASTAAITITLTSGAATFTAATPITVSAKAVTGISVTTPPSKTSYIEGQVFDPTGMVVTASYNNETSAVVSDYTYPTTGLSKSATHVTISYKSGKSTFTAKTHVTVSAKAVTGITVTTPPAKTVYTEGQVFSPSGMVVTATFNTGTTAAITGYTYDKSPLKASAAAVTITYSTSSGKFTATTPITVLSKVTTPSVTLSNSVVYDTKTKPGEVIMNVLGTFKIPTGSHVTDSGFISVKDPPTNPGTSLTLNTQGITIIQASVMNAQGQVYRSILTPFGSTFYVRGYITFVDGSGSTITIYSSNVVKAAKK